MVIGTIKDDFEGLLTEGSVGFYNHAEIISIFLVKAGKSYNFLTRVVFLEDDEDDFKRINLTEDGLRTINNEVSLGIIQEKVNLSNSKDIFEDLVTNKIWRIHDNDGDLIIGDLDPLPKSFVPKLQDVPSNAVLKDNGDNASYIIEFFSKEFNILNLNNNEFKKICRIILEYIPIDLCFLTDRVGNILFQFPINLIKKTRIKFDEVDVKITLQWHDLLETIPEVEVFININYDDNIIGHTSFSGVIPEEIDLKCGNSNGAPNVLIKSNESNLILYYTNEFLMNIGMKIGVNYTNGSRTINIDDEVFDINLTSCETSQMGFDTLNHIMVTKDRKYDSTSHSLMDQKKFLQYGESGVDCRDEAITDIRSIIKENCRNGLNIWDPYATSEDILRTAYFCECANTHIKVINSFSHEKKDKYEVIKEKTISDYEDFKNDETAILNSKSNNKDINLEIRCQRNEGWKFHDRFIIFPGSMRTKPRAWTIGTSLNSIGKSHSILMEVENSQNILDAFNKLWSELENSVLFKYP